MRDKAKIERHARMMTAKGNDYILFQYDTDLWGWATVSSPLGAHILGSRPNSIFSCYSDPRNVSIRTR